MSKKPNNLDRQVGQDSKDNNHLADDSELVVSNDRPENSSENGIRLMQEYFSGPIPHPKILERYNKLVPTAAERLISMAEKEQAQRHKQEEKYQSSNALNEKIGLVGTLGLCLVLTILGYQLIASGKSAEGLFVMLPTLGLLIKEVLGPIFSRIKDQISDGDEVTDNQSESEHQTTAENTTQSKDS